MFFRWENRSILEQKRSFVYRCVCVCVFSLAGEVKSHWFHLVSTLDFLGHDPEGNIEFSETILMRMIIVRIKLMMMRRVKMNMMILEGHMLQLRRSTPSAPTQDTPKPRHPIFAPLIFIGFHRPCYILYINSW